LPAVDNVSDLQFLHWLTCHSRILRLTDVWKLHCSYAGAQFSQPGVVLAGSAGQGFTPHIITIAAGEVSMFLSDLLDF
jgi:hypothetical protein